MPALPLQRPRPAERWTVSVDPAQVAGCLCRLQAVGWRVRSASRRPHRRVELELEREL